MTIDHALVALFGAGLATVASAAHDLTLSEGTVSNGADVIDRMARSGHGAAMMGVLDEFARDVRNALHHDTFSTDEFTLHAAAIPAILESFGPDANLLRAAARRQAAPGEVGRITLGIVERAAATGRISRAGLDPSIVRQLIELLFSRLLAETGYVASLRIGLAEVAQPRQGANGRPADAPRPVPNRTSRRRIELPAEHEDLVRRVSAEEGAPLELLRAALACHLKRGMTPVRAPQLLRVSARDFRMLDAMLARRSGADAIVLELRSEAAQAVREGQFEQADELLSGAEARDLISPNAADGLRRTASIDTRTARARLAALRGAYIVAAQHCDTAIATLETDGGTSGPNEANYSARQLKLQKARILIRQGREFTDDDALVEAAAELNEMIAAIEASDGLESHGRDDGKTGLGPRSQSGFQSASASGFAQSGNAALGDWFTANETLGDALVLLGERTRDPNHLARAARAYVSVLDKIAAPGEGNQLHAPDDWARLTHNAGIAFMRLGELTGETRALFSAMEALRAALGVFQPSQTPAAWAACQLDLASVLTSIGLRQAIPERLEEAEIALRQVIRHIDPARLARPWIQAQLKLGKILQELSHHGQAARRLDEAVDALYAADHALPKDAPATERAAIQSQIGDTLYALGLEQGLIDVVLEGVQEQQLALEIFQAAGDAEQAQQVLESLRGKLDQLQKSMATRST